MKNKTEVNESKPSTSSALTTVLKVVKSHMNALLSTARIRICNDGQNLKVRALVDQCAQSSFVTEELCQRLRLRKRKVNIPISGIGKKEVNCQAEVELMIRPHFESSFACTFSAYVLPRITAYEPIPIDTGDWNHIKDLQLADPEFGDTGRIDVLLGTKVHAMIIQEGLRKGHDNMPIAMKTSLGWILSGTTRGQSSTPTVHVQAIDLDDRLKTFWEIEEIPKVSHLTIEDQKCEEHYLKNTKRLDSGAYQVRLPVREKIPDHWKNSRQIALKCLRSLEFRLSKKTELLSEYNKALKTMLDEKRMTKVTVSDDSKHYFMPHHAVVKESSNTTRVRPVFNASAKNCDGFSLNNILMTGPNLLPDLVMTLARWRLYQFAFVADVAKMYLNILLDPSDWPLQTILWRESFDSPVETYALNTVTFGCCSSPFLASRTLRQLAMDEGTTYLSYI